MKAIGVDVGGTFTDIVYCDMETGHVAIHKVSTTPDDPSRGILQGISEICRDGAIAPGDIDYLLHGTTTATNAVLEHKGARTGMLTNKGFRDIIHIARHQRVEHYSIMQELPWQNRPLVRRRHRKVVGGRLIPPTGAELEPLDEAGIVEAARALKAAGAKAVYLAGRPGDLEAALKAAGVDDFIFMGLDVLASLKAVQAQLSIRVED